MANNCYFEMRAVGLSEDSLKKFFECVSARYNYNYNMETRRYSLDYCTADKHLFRVFDAYLNYLDEEDDGKYAICISGDCAWSVSCCMFGGKHSYYHDFSNKVEPGTRFYGTTIPLLAKQFDIDIEIFSDEGSFMEHYLVRKDGTIEVDESVECDEETENDEQIDGFKEWDYNI